MASQRRFLLLPGCFFNLYSTDEGGLHLQESLHMKQWAQHLTPRKQRAVAPSCCHHSSLTITTGNSFAGNSEKLVSTHKFPCSPQASKSIPPSQGTTLIPIQDPNYLQKTLQPRCNRSSFHSCRSDHTSTHARSYSQLPRSLINQTHCLKMSYPLASSLLHSCKSSPTVQ